jgi:hypothetical protein
VGKLGSHGLLEICFGACGRCSAHYRICVPYSSRARHTTLVESKYHVWVCECGTLDHLVHYGFAVLHLSSGARPWIHSIIVPTGCRGRRSCSTGSQAQGLSGAFLYFFTNLSHLSHLLLRLARYLDDTLLAMFQCSVIPIMCSSLNDLIEPVKSNVDLS